MILKTCFRSWLLSKLARRRVSRKNVWYEPCPSVVLVLLDLTIRLCTVQYFTRPIKREDWDRFLRIASSVQCLRILNANPPQMHTSAMHAIRTSCPVTHPLPSLRELRMRQTRDSLKFILLHPEIVELALSCDDSLVVQTMKKVAHLKHITRLTLYGCLVTTKHASAVAKALGGLINLQEFDFDAMAWNAPAIFQALSHLPTLKDITYEGPYTEVEDTAEFVAARGDFLAEGFPALNGTSLSVPDNDSDKVSALLRSFHFGHLQRLSIIFRPNDRNISIPEASRNSQIFRAIADACPSVAQLNVRFRGDSEDQPLSFNDLKPIVFKLRIRRFRISHPHPLGLVHLDVAAIAEAWGDTLVEIELNPSPTYRHPTTLDLAAIVPFARYCPRLESLHIYVDATLPLTLLADGTSASEIPPFPPSFYGLAFGRSRIADHIDASKLLERMIRPSVHSMVMISGTRDDEPEDEIWREISLNLRRQRRWWEAMQQAKVT